MSSLFFQSSFSPQLLICYIEGTQNGLNSAITIKAKSVSWELMLAREDEMAWGPVVKKPQEMPQAKICIISLRWKWTPKKKKGKMDFFSPTNGSNGLILDAEDIWGEGMCSLTAKSKFSVISALVFNTVQSKLWSQGRPELAFWTSPSWTFLLLYLKKQKRRRNIQIQFCCKPLTLPAFC